MADLTLTLQNRNILPLPQPFSKYGVCLASQTVYNLKSGKPVAPQFRGPRQRAFVNIYRDDERPGKPERVTVQVAELILRATQGAPKFKHYEVSHIDNDCTNNSPENLRWESKRGNIKRYHEQHGCEGWLNPNAKLNLGHYYLVRDLLNKGMSKSAIARKLNVHPATISRLAKRLMDERPEQITVTATSTNPFFDQHTE